MSSAVGELDAALQAMLSLKPPGVSGSKINSVTSLCIANIQSESVLVQKLYTHFKKTPGTHKLGVLYVVDSVTRQWVDHAKKTGQVPGSSASDGTFAAGVNRVTELMPVLMTDIIQHAPEDQKDKIRKLVDIWERGSTFPGPMIASFKEKLDAPRNIVSNTPPGSPPQALPQQGQQASNLSTMPAQNTSDILAALAKMAQQNTAAPPAAKAAPQDNHNNVTNSQTAMPPHVSSSVNQPAAFQAPTQPVNMPVGMPNLVNQFGGSALNGNAVPNAPNPLASIAAAMPQANGGASTEALQQQLMLVQVLMQQGIPQEQWGPIIAALSAQGANANLTAGAGAITNASNGMAGSNVGGFGGVAGGAASGASSAWPPPSGPQSSWDGRKDQQSRDPAGNANRSPPGRYQRRDRSRSPAYGRGSPPLRKRDSPIYGEYNSSDSPGRGGGGRGDALDRRGRGNRGRGRATDYRQRSPPPGRRSPERHDSSGAPSKWMDFDPLLGKDNIKVLSRTLFVGGVTSSESDLKGVFSQFGNVQTCIVNVDRHHAFIKMVTRDEAVIAKEGMETHRSPNMQLRTRWGVGFGPRDCSDYQTGISIIPIHRLTDADRKWMLTAEYGGSGGKPIEGGMVVEEPDIEIGAGVSSKAISRRMATDQGGRTGPRSSRIPGAPETGGGARFRRPDRHDGPGPAPESVNAIGVPPAVPGFGFQMPGGMPMFPPGFTFPGSNPQQPPPPGQG